MDYKEIKVVYTKMITKKLDIIFFQQVDEQCVQPVCLVVCFQLVEIFWKWNVAVSTSFRFSRCAPPNRQESTRLSKLEASWLYVRNYVPDPKNAIILKLIESTNNNNNNNLVSIHTLLFANNSQGASRVFFTNFSTPIPFDTTSFTRCCAKSLILCNNILSKVYLEHCINSLMINILKITK